MKDRFTTDRYGNKFWQDEKGYFHRDNDKPAVEFVSGGREWYLHGRRHRENGPAVLTTTGHKYWFIDGHFHRKDGPAVEMADGDNSWWYFGQHIKCQSQEEFERIINLLIFE